MKKILTFVLTILILSIGVKAGLADQWAKTYGGTREDVIYSIQETSDGGYTWAGLSESFTTNSGFDAWVVKLASDETITWQKIYGGSKYEWTSSIQETADGYIVAGYTESFGAGGGDAWVIKLNNDGTIAWQKAYGDVDSDEAAYINQTADDGYIVAGRTRSFGVGDSDMWLLKLNSVGAIDWQYRYGSNGLDTACCVEQTLDEGYIVAGDTWDIVSGVTGDSDIVVMKLNSDGSISWQKTYGDIDDDSVCSIHQTSDEGYVVAGDTRSFGGISKIWVLKLTSTGTIAWQKILGGDSATWQWSYATSVRETTGGGYVIAGYTFDYGAGWSDLWVLKLDASGALSWQKTYGGSDFDRAYSIQETSDGGYVVAGLTWSFGAGDDDSLVLKLDSNGDIPDCNIIASSTATASDTYVSAEDAYLARIATTATPVDTTASAENTSASTEQLCPLSGIDSDGDGIPDVLDNCPSTPNPSQEDTYPPTGNGIGDACECEGNFDCDSDQDGSDAATFKADYGRSSFKRPCTDIDPCNGDFTCDGDVDGTDASLFKSDFGRSQYKNPCPLCVVGDWCNY